MSLVLLSHAPTGSMITDPAQRAMWRLAEVAAQNGIPVHAVPVRPTGARDERVATLPLDGATCLLGGYWSGREAYAELQAGVEAAGGRMLHTVADEDVLAPLTGWYPHVQEFTAASVVVSTAADLDAAAALGFPLFCKGLVKSSKEAGWASCVAEDLEALTARLPGGPFAARQILPLRRTGERVMDFPTAREYRAYAAGGVPVGLGYYWHGADPFGAFTPGDRAAITALVSIAAQRLGTPLACVDVGQLEDGTWVIIEVGDPQFSGISHMPPVVYLDAVRALV